MALTNVLLLSQIAGYVVALILSLCITVPMSIHQDEFRGHCLLFSTGTWQETDGQLNVHWASQAYCNYTIFVGVVLFVISAIQIYRMSLFLYKGTDSSFLSAFVDVVGSIFLCAMIIVAALMITLGFLVWCEDMTKRFPSCEVAVGKAIDKQDGIDTSGFYIEMGTAQFGAWASWACWVGLTVFAILKLCRYHQLENMRVSMYRERQRLINGQVVQEQGNKLEEPSHSRSDVYNYPQAV
uniref:Transmembrane protein 179 n=3 Tax=Timema TaxID=61471 RepID=A0A7R9IGN9_9NEOP|nr:unnamed protein product [Timema bartmani]CAD7458078.1 unnamed protein product [Timema tahoe]CAD7589983.1 unnamed protein product [Timema genevievae]